MSIDSLLHQWECQWSGKHVQTMVQQLVTWTLTGSSVA